MLHEDGERGAPILLGKSECVEGESVGLGEPSYTSVQTMRASGTSSRYVLRRVPCCLCGVEGIQLLSVAMWRNYNHALFACRMASDKSVLTPGTADGPAPRRFTVARISQRNGVV